ncbi:hypothetical protein [Aeromonas veronii]|uniref:hypothetical protein n=1 Tax=Aeromonas veronii TaxID=654 RepID=UPI00366E4E8C
MNVRNLQSAESSIEREQYLELAQIIMENCTVRPCSPVHYEWRVAQACSNLGKRIATDHLLYVLQAAQATKDNLPTVLYLHAMDITLYTTPEIKSDATKLASLKRIVQAEAKRLRLLELELVENTPKGEQIAITPEGSRRSAEEVTERTVEPMPSVQPDAS